LQARFDSVHHFLQLQEIVDDEMRARPGKLPARLAQQQSALPRRQRLEFRLFAANQEMPLNSYF
jgi:hypothetical protein